MDVEITYEIDGDQQVTNYTGVIVTPNFTSAQATLKFPQITGDYDNLYNDMKNSPTGLKIKFEAFGADSEYENLKVKSAIYSKTLRYDFSELCDLTIILEQE